MELGKRKFGFTLVELLVVIGVVAILGSLLLPALVRAKEQGRTARCGSNVRQMMVAMRMYVDDFGCYPAVYRWEESGYTKDWQEVLAPYLSLQSPYVLPEEPPAEYLTTVSVFKCPSYKEYGSRCYADGGGLAFVPWSMYGYNSQSPYALSRSAVGPDDSDTSYTGEAMIARPAEMIAIGDADLVAYEKPMTVVGKIDLQYIPIKYRQGNAALFEREQKAVKERHNGRELIGFCDGHAESIPFMKLFANEPEARRIWNYDYQPHDE
jgi:prepilin-type N-terminal cleavage/methylation domain-containing protein